MNGILLIDKPSGWTSFDVVAKVRSMLRQAKSPELRVQSPKLSALSSQHTAPSPKVRVGHTGTLDPLATGLLVLVAGDYCKRAGEFSKLDKTYEVTMRLGQTSTTGDEEGEKTMISDIKPPVEAISDVLKRFTGDIAQIPPAYSAIKIDGQRAYKLARAGKEVKLEPRNVTIYDLKLTDYTYPDVKFTAIVSSGTYIRSLVTDIGEQLGTGAYMSALRRTAVGGFTITQAASMDTLEPETLATKLVSAS